MLASTSNVVLPDPPDLRPLLVSQGVDTETTEEVCARYRTHTDNLREKIEHAIAIHAETMSELPDLLAQLPGFNQTLPALDLVQFYWQTVNEWVHIALDAASVYQAQQASFEESTYPVDLSLLASTELDIDFDHPEKYGLLPGFNYDYTEHLLAFFEFNPYPSNADKAVIATKAMMSATQVHHWFQNRRRRLGAKNLAIKKGQVPAEASLQFAQQLPTFTYMPSSSASSSSNTESESEEETEDNLKFDSLRKPAFGSPSKKTRGDLLQYDSSSSVSSLEDRFPCKNGDFSLPKPVWRRSPSSSTSSLPSTSSTVYDLRTEFRKLSLAPEQEEEESDDEEEEQNLWTRTKNMARRAATAAFTVIPLDAPVCRSALLSSPSSSAKKSKRKQEKKAKEEKKAAKKPTERKPRLTKRTPSTAPKKAKASSYSRSMSTASSSRSTSVSSSLRSASTASFSSSDSSLIRTPSPSPRPESQPQLQPEEMDLSWLNQDLSVFHEIVPVHSVPEKQFAPDIITSAPVATVDNLDWLNMDIPLPVQTSSEMMDFNGLFDFLGCSMPETHDMGINAPIFNSLPFNNDPTMLFTDTVPNIDCSTYPTTNFNMPMFDFSQPMDAGFVDPRLLTTTPAGQMFNGFANVAVPQWYSCSLTGPFQNIFSGAATISAIFIVVYTLICHVV